MVFRIPGLLEHLSLLRNLLSTCTGKRGGTRTTDDIQARGETRKGLRPIPASMLYFPALPEKKKRRERETAEGRKKKKERS